jgi:microcystin-dependent protein
MSDRGYTDPAAQYVSRLAGYDQRIQMLERSHSHPLDTPVGAIVDWPAATLPDGTWQWCFGGSLLVAAYPDLFAVLGYLYGGSGPNFLLPDLRGRAVIGAGTGAGLTPRGLNARGGAETVSLTGPQNGAHNHLFAATSSGAAPGTHNHPIALTSAGAAPGTHTHGFTTGGVSVVHRHNLPGGSFAQTVVQAGNTQGIFGSVGSALTDGESADHSHTGNTGGPSADHSHTLTGNSGNQIGDHSHSLNALTDGGGATGAAHENMPPFAALNKIIRALPNAAAAFTALSIIERTS